MMSKRLVVVYRGPLERTRLAFIFELVLNKDQPAEFVWICPFNHSEEKRAFSLDFLMDYFKTVKIIDDKWYQYFSTTQKLRRSIPDSISNCIVAIGYSTPAFLLGYRKSPVTWFINGIPEEGSMHSQGVRGRLMPIASWRLVRLLSPRPIQIITVSSRMSAYVKKYFPDAAITHAPTCADLETFRFRGAKKKGYITYCGTGAPWQAIDLTKAVWEEIYALDRSAKFRVISRDPRCKVLGERLPASQIEFVQSNDHKKVAEYLHECNIAFMLRRDNIVNRVCFPTKFAQYLASGCAVVTSDIDWDIRDYVTPEIGVVVDPDADPKVIARAAVEFCRSMTIKPQEIASHAEQLSRQYWVAKIRAQLLLTSTTRRS